MIIILTFIAFTGLVALISWYKTKEENLSTKEGYFLAGRGLTGLVIAGSLEMTNLSTEQLVGQAGQSYSTNMGAMSWSVNASIALLALALIFLPKYLKAGITTIPEFLEVRFDRTTKQIISFLFLLGYMLTYLRPCCTPARWPSTRFSIWISCSASPLIRVLRSCVLQSALSVLSTQSSAA